MTYRLHPKPQAKIIPIIDILGKDLIRFDYDTKGQFSKFNIDFKRCPIPTITKANKNHFFATFKDGTRRKLTITECKKFASFPDDYHFVGSPNQQWQRIGNSVPPKLMYSIANHLASLSDNDCGANTRKKTFVSLFAGCGGSSLGFKMAGYDELLAVEWDDHAVQCLRHNFPDLTVYHGDISQLSDSQALAMAGLEPGQLFCLQASPPCQGFSLAGARDYNDDRNKLFREFIRLLNAFKPEYVVMENVKGLVVGYMRRHYLDCINAIRDCGYDAKGQIMNAKWYSVPQSRERVIIVGKRIST